MMLIALRSILQFRFRAIATIKRIHFSIDFTFYYLSFISHYTYRCPDQCIEFGFLSVCTVGI